MSMVSPTRCNISYFRHLSNRESRNIIGHCRGNQIFAYCTVAIVGIRPPGLTTSKCDSPSARTRKPNRPAVVQKSTPRPHNVAMLLHNAVRLTGHKGSQRKRLSPSSCASRRRRLQTQPMDDIHVSPLHNAEPRKWIWRGSTFLDKTHMLRIAPGGQKPSGSCMRLNTRSRSAHPDSPWFAPACKDFRLLEALLPLVHPRCRSLIEDHGPRAVKAGLGREDLRAALRRGTDVRLEFG